MLENLLKQLGFSEKEIALYLCVLEHGKLSAAAVARITKINRTTVYSVSKELISKGVITEDIGGSNRYYTALPVEEFRQVYKKEEQTIKEKQKIVEQLIGELALVPKSKNYSVPKIRFIDERQLNDFLHKQLPNWIESAKSTDPNWWGFQDVSLLENYSDWVEYHWEIFPENMGLRLFTNKKPAEQELATRELKERRQVKYWDKSIDFTATHVVLGNYVIFIVTNQHPHYLVETHDAVMAENLRQMFRAMWETI